jgi:hypothetical protein
MRTYHPLSHTESPSTKADVLQLHHPRSFRYRVACDCDEGGVSDVASRPRFGGDSQARAPQLERDPAGQELAGKA